MKTEQQRIAIAEACGWYFMDDSWHYPNGANAITTPDYLNDLNAMHEAEKRLIGDEIHHGHQQAIFCNHLFRVLNPTMGGAGVGEFDKIHATAAQRAESFLRTLNLWTNES
jgi:hypothetical protein